MANKVIVLVSDLDDAVHGEINVMESPDQAARFVETLLESGFEQERIRVFTGGEMSMEVRHRPVVSLGSSRASKEESPEPTRQGQEEVADTAAEEEVEQPVAATANARSRTLRVEEVGGEPFTKNGVRFSSLFRPA